MLSSIQISIDRPVRKKTRWNAVLALIAGVCALIWPNLIYYIVGGYLVALSLLLFAFGISSFLTALTALSALMIFLFPSLIPVTFALFLGLFGVIFLISFQLVPLGVIMIIFALLIGANPDSVAYMIAFFLLLYGSMHLVSAFRNRVS